MKLKASSEMKIPKKGIEEYRKLIERKYSLDISHVEAEEGFHDLLSLFDAIYRPINGFDKNDSAAYNQDGAKNEKR